MAHTRSPDVPPDGPVDAEAIAKGYEPHDIGLRAVFTFIAVLSVTLVVVLAMIYAIMMALAEHDRSGDPIASPVTVKLPPVYAPLQPSLGFYGDSSTDHDTFDADDMVAMRYQVQQELNAPAGVSEAGRSHKPIDAAIDTALSLLVTKPAIAPTPATTQPAGSYEGFYPDPNKRPEESDPSVHKNSMDRLIVDN